MFGGGRFGGGSVEVSTVQARDAGVGSTLVAGSVARTSKTWAPPASPVRETGLVQDANAATSRRHSNVEPPSEEKSWNEADVERIVPEGPNGMVVSGAVVSTVNDRPTEEPAEPEALTAITSSVWGPSASAGVAKGVGQGANADGSEESMRHSK